MSYPLIQAKVFHYGRPPGVTPRLIVIHTTENVCKAGVARAVASYFQHGPFPQGKGSSSTFVVDPGEVICCVREEDTAMHAPPVNPYSIGIEHTAYACTGEKHQKYVPTDWDSVEARAMLENAANLVAYLCAKYNIPVARVADLTDPNASGIVGHDEVTATFKHSTHVDPGITFPWDEYLARIVEVGV